MSDAEWKDEQEVMDIEEYLKEVGSVEVPDATFVAVHSQIREIVIWIEDFYDVEDLVDSMNECAQSWSTATVTWSMTKQEATLVLQNLYEVVECRVVLRVCCYDGAACAEARRRVLPRGSVDDTVASVGLVLAEDPR